MYFIPRGGGRKPYSTSENEYEITPLSPQKSPHPRQHRLYLVLLLLNFLSSLLSPLYFTTTTTTTTNITITMSATLSPPPPAHSITTFCLLLPSSYSTNTKHQSVTQSPSHLGTVFITLFYCPSPRFTLLLYHFSPHHHLHH